MGNNLNPLTCHPSREALLEDLTEYHHFENYEWERVKQISGIEEGETLYITFKNSPLLTNLSQTDI